MLDPRPSGALVSCRNFQHTFLPSLRGRSHTRVGDLEQGSLVRCALYCALGAKQLLFRSLNRPKTKDQRCLSTSTSLSPGP